MDKNEKPNCAVTLMPLEPLEKGSTELKGGKKSKSNSWVLLVPTFQTCAVSMLSSL